MSEITQKQVHLEYEDVERAAKMLVMDVPTSQIADSLGLTEEEFDELTLEEEFIQIWNKVKKEKAERFLDNAVYVGYAPADNPQIAIAVVTENAGHGGESAAPVARLVLDAFFEENN